MDREQRAHNRNLFSWIVFQSLIVGVVVWFCMSTGIAGKEQGNYAPAAVGIAIAYWLTLAIMKFQDWLRRRRLNREFPSSNKVA